MKITKWTGEKISDPCIIDGCPEDQYHHDPCIGPSVSSSGLRTIENESPAHYWVRSPYNPNRLEDERKEHFDFGKAAHTLLLVGEDEFARKFILRPDEYPDKKTGELKKWTRAAGYCADWHANAEAKGLIVITKEDRQHIDGMAESLRKTPEIAAGLFDGYVEHSLFWQDKKTGIWLKSRPDVIPTSDGVLSDAKSTIDASPRWVDRAIVDYGYHMQGALASVGMEVCAGVKVTNFVLVFVEKTPPYAVSVVDVDPGYMDIGRQQLRRALDTFANCLKTGEWPAFGPARTAYAPQWLVDRIDREEQHGLISREGL